MEKKTKKTTKKTTDSSPYKIDIKAEKDADGVKGRFKLTIKLFKDGELVAVDSDFIKL